MMLFLSLILTNLRNCYVQVGEMRMAEFSSIGYINLAATFVTLVFAFQVLLIFESVTLLFAFLVLLTLSLLEHFWKVVLEA